MGNPFCPGCKNTHCCLTCDNYTGCISLIPTRLTGIGCTKRPDDNISLHIGGWPKINGKTEKRCEFWVAETMKPDENREEWYGLSDENVERQEEA